MLATLNQVLKIAEEKQYAIAAFNTPTLESLQAAIDKAEEHQVPVIVAVSYTHLAEQFAFEPPCPPSPPWERLSPL